MRSRTGGFLGIVACIVFWSAMFIFGSLRPSYSHMVNSISELGALGTPNAILWNVFGFIIPGLLLAVTGNAIADSINSASSKPGKIARWLLPLFGMTIAGQGCLPAKMANGEPVVASWHTRGHLIISLVSGIAWILAALILAVPIKRNSDWGGMFYVNIVAVLLVIGGSFALRGILPDGLAQRVVDAVVFTWFILMSLKLILRGNVSIGSRS
jgi:hypothetical membrane protein